MGVGYGYDGKYGPISEEYQNYYEGARNASG